MKILLLFLLPLIWTGCNGIKEQKGDKTYIVCTTGMIADAVSQIVGPYAQVESLMGPGVDPHLYKATQGDLLKLQEADIIVYNGLFLEGKMGEILGSLKRKKTVIAMAETLPHGALINNTEFQGAFDPHIWFDVALWNRATGLLAEQLMESDSLHAKEFQENYKRYSKSLDSLHLAVDSAIATIPEQQKILITAHDAFGYFGRAYRIQVRGLQGISTLSEFGLRDVSDLVDYITEQKIPAIFTETSVSKKAINAVLEGCRSKGHLVEIGGSLYSDAMGAEDTKEGTYIGMVDANVQKIVKGLSKKSIN